MSLVPSEYGGTITGSLSNKEKSQDLCTVQSSLNGVRHQCTRSFHWKPNHRVPLCLRRGVLDTRGIHWRLWYRRPLHVPHQHPQCCRKRPPWRNAVSLSWQDIIPTGRGHRTGSHLNAHQLHHPPLRCLDVCVTPLAPSKPSSTKSK